MNIRSSPLYTGVRSTKQMRVKSSREYCRLDGSKSRHFYIIRQKFLKLWTEFYQKSGYKYILETTRLPLLVYTCLKTLSKNAECCPIIPLSANEFFEYLSTQLKWIPFNITLRIPCHLMSRIHTNMVYASYKRFLRLKNSLR